MLITNIRLVWKGLQGTKTLAYLASLPATKEKVIQRCHQEKMADRAVQPRHKRLSMFSKQQTRDMRFRQGADPIKLFFSTLLTKGQKPLKF